MIEQQENITNINITDSALFKVYELIAEENNFNLKLRIFVQGGGCSGFQYGFTFEEQSEPDEGIGENQSDHRKRNTRRRNRNIAGVGCHDRSERFDTSEAIQGDDRCHRSDSDEIGRNGERRGHPGDSSRNGHPR